MVRELKSYDLKLLELFGFKYLVTDGYGGKDEYMIILLTPYIDYESGYLHYLKNSRSLSVLEFECFEEWELVDNYHLKVFIDFPEVNNLIFIKDYSVEGK